MNSFIAIYNQSGIACASDTDNTIYRLSKEEPVAIATCPYSPIPWESIITHYLRKGEPKHHKTLEMRMQGITGMETLNDLLQFSSEQQSK